MLWPLSGGLLKTENALTHLSIEEAVKLGARDIPTFGHIFLPRTFRQKSPEFHFEMSAALEDQRNRLIGFKIFRDGAKTTLARAYMAKRIAYCISRTLMIVNIAGTKAQHTLRWLKRQVEYNATFRDAFLLRKGDKWTDEWCSFINAQGEQVNVVAMGITGGLRGLNIDDYRPDFIFCDDISDRENTATDEQRQKAEEAFFAQLVRSLAPASESPLAQLVIAQTPINMYDLISKASKDPQFKVLTYGCFDEAGQSRWPDRRSTDALRAEKQGYINRNQLSTWLAEMECELVSAESSYFQVGWIKRWQVFPEDGRVAIICDPASSAESTADFFAIVVMLFHKGKAYVLEYANERGMMPDIALAKIFEFALTYKARDLVVETIGFQKVLKWYFEQQMRERRIHLTVHEMKDRRKKEDRIVQAVTQVAPYGALFLRDNMAELEEQFTLYGPGYVGHDDLLDAMAMGIIWNTGRLTWGSVDSDPIEAEYRELREMDSGLEEAIEWQGAP